MKKRLAICIATLCLAVSAASIRAQAPSEPPKPGPEQQNLAYFVGKWLSEGDMKPSPFGPGGKFSFTQTCDWFTGNFSLVCHTEASMFGSVIKGLSIMGYDMGEKTYVYFETNSMGENNFSRGKLDGETWIWTGDSTVNGQAMHSRFTLKRVSDDTATYKFEMAAGTDPLVLVMDGKQTRQK